ncbi:MAG TPA: helix-turn-helix transcriptional regulator [Dongiaceae bacterium]|jgi:predicted XRE-type DNA-binding protein
MKKSRIEQGGGNVFADIRSKDPQEKLLRAKLLSAAQTVIKRRRLTQAKIVEITGLKQPEVSNLVNGKFTAFSADRVASILASLGYDVEVRLKAKADAPRHSSAAT